MYFLGGGVYGSTGTYAYPPRVRCVAVCDRSFGHWQIDYLIEGDWGLRPQAPPMCVKLPCSARPRLMQPFAPITGRILQGAIMPRRTRTPP